MSKQWEIILRVKQEKVDGKIKPSKQDIQNFFEPIAKQTWPPFIKDSLKVVNKANTTSKSKGNDYERRVAKLLGEWWWGQPFRRTPSSGGWDKLAQDGQVMASGDLIAPPEAKFPFCIECKKRKEHINFFATQSEASDVVFDWWKQCIGDAKAMNQQPLLVFNCHSQEYIAFDTSTEDFPLDGSDIDSLNWLDMHKRGVFMFQVMPLKQFLEVFRSNYVKES